MVLKNYFLGVWCHFNNEVEDSMVSIGKIGSMYDE